MTASSYQFLICLLLTLIIAPTYAQQQPITDTTIEEDNGLSNLNLPPCPATSYEISQYGPETPLSACILYDLNPPNNDNDNSDSNASSFFTEVGLIQITPSICHNHRDGANTAISILNNDNNGRGVAIGFSPSTTYIKFRLISIIGGNNNNIGNDAYSIRLEEILDEVFQNVDNVHFILGSCSFASANDKPMALKHGENCIESSWSTWILYGCGE